VSRPKHKHSPSTADRLMPDLDAALEKRAPLLSREDTNVCRLLNGAADGIPGLVIDRFGDVLVTQLHEGRLRIPAGVARTLCEAALRHTGGTAVYRKTIPHDRTKTYPELDEQHRDPQPWIGQPAPEEFAVREAGAVHLVRPYDGYGTGLFLEHRAHRAVVRERAEGRRVLNTFSYTGGFSVSAALGKAAETVSVDVSKKSLEWAKRNLSANGIKLDDHRFICSDIFDYFKRARRQGRRFDFIILDPPTLGRARRPARRFNLADDLDDLTAQAVELLDLKGVMLLSVNHQGTPRSRLVRVLGIAASKAGRRVIQHESPKPPADFAKDPDHQKSVLAIIS